MNNVSIGQSKLNEVLTALITCRFSDVRKIMIPDVTIYQIDLVLTGVFYQVMDGRLGQAPDLTEEMVMLEAKHLQSTERNLEFADGQIIQTSYNEKQKKSHHFRIQLDANLGSILQVLQPAVTSALPTLRMDGRNLPHKITSFRNLVRPAVIKNVKSPEMSFKLQSGSPALAVALSK